MSNPIMQITTTSSSKVNPRLLLPFPDSPLRIPLFATTFLRPAITDLAFCCDSFDDCTPGQSPLPDLFFTPSRPQSATGDSCTVNSYALLPKNNK